VALVLFLQTNFKGVKASVYNRVALLFMLFMLFLIWNGEQNVREENPLAVIKFKNTFGVPLESGPLCLFEDNAYVGECMLPRVRPNDDV